MSWKAVVLSLLAPARACQLLQLADYSNCTSPEGLHGRNCCCIIDLQSSLQRPATAGLCIDMQGMLQCMTYVCLDRLCVNHHVMVAN